MKRVLFSALRAFVGAAVPVLAGLSAVPTLSAVTALSVTALVAGGAAALRTVQVLIPGLTTTSLLDRVGLGKYAAIVDSFVRAALSSLAVFTLGVLSAPNLSLTSAAVVAALTGAFTAGVRAIEGFLTKGETPVPATGT